MVCAELAPLAKTGGLADAVAGLSAALGRGGHDVRVLLPKYGPLPDGAEAMGPVTHRGAGHRYLELRLETEPVRVYLLDAPGLFGDGRIYTGDERDAARFIGLCEAAVRFGAATGWTPDVVHCHDWHAALVPAFAGGCPSVLTLHNIGYQGVFDARVLDARTRAALASFVDESGTPGTINFLRAGVQSADALTTVSPTYAREIQTSAFGMGLEDALRARAPDLVGILNGVDYSVWDPRVDPHIEFHYGINDVRSKERVKRALCTQLGIAYTHAPLLGLVTRLAAQKGIDLLTAILPQLLERTTAALALLGTGDRHLERELRSIAQAAPERVSFTRGYDETLAHRILAGSDLVLVPSRYEPCGLTQMYALRYGSIPVVRATGGLADTIRHFDPGTGTGNGSVFEHADAQGLAWGIDEALAWLADARARATLMRNAMSADFSWQKQVGRYIALYQRVLASSRP